MRLLLVEDDAALAANVHTGLKRAGFAVDIATNGVDAEFMGNEEPYDAVILDLGLPQRNGLEVLRHWRQSSNLVPVIILTARDAWHERVDGFKAGADDYLGKPFHFEELFVGYFPTDFDDLLFDYFLLVFFHFVILFIISNLILKINDECGIYWIFGKKS